jgi:hypothetical protein
MIAPCYFLACLSRKGAEFSPFFSVLLLWSSTSLGEHFPQTLMEAYSSAVRKVAAGKLPFDNPLLSLFAAADKCRSRKPAR